MTSEEMSAQLRTETVARRQLMVSKHKVPKHWKSCCYFQPRRRRPLGLARPLLWGHPVPCRMLSSIPGLHALDAISTPRAPVVTSKKVPWEAKIPPVQNQCPVPSGGTNSHVAMSLSSMRKGFSVP